MSNPIKLAERADQFMLDGIEESIELLRDNTNRVIAIATIAVYQDGRRAYSYTAEKHNAKAALIGRLHWLANKLIGDLK